LATTKKTASARRPARSTPDAKRATAAPAPAPRPAAAGRGANAALRDGIGDAAVRARTGRTWAQWFAVLERAGAADLPHKEIAKLLQERYGVAPWWGQMVTVAYERARGRRALHESGDGYQAGISRTLPVGPERACAAWSTARERARWLGRGRLTVRTVQPGRSLRLTLADGGVLEVQLYGTPGGGTRCSLQQRRLPDEAAVRRFKDEWGAALERLRAALSPARAR